MLLSSPCLWSSQSPSPAPLLSIWSLSGLAGTQAQYFPFQLVQPACLLFPSCLLLLISIQLLGTPPPSCPTQLLCHLHPHPSPSFCPCLVSFLLPRFLGTTIPYSPSCTLSPALSLAFLPTHPSGVPSGHWYHLHRHECGQREGSRPAQL